MSDSTQPNTQTDSETEAQSSRNTKTGAETNVESQTTTEKGTSTDSEEFIQLQGAQARIRDAYLDADAGLFILNALAGAGKSTTLTDVVARVFLRRFATGDFTPDETLTVVSFNTDEAEKLVPKITDRIHELVAHDAVPAATELTDAEVSLLIQRVRQAASIGTIDSILRQILSDVSADVGFESAPTVGNDLRLARIHSETFETIASNPTHNAALDTVEAAYPPGDYDDGPAALLKNALKICRTRRWSPGEFADAARTTVAAVYEEGRTDSFGDIAAALDRCLDPETAASIRTELDDQTKTELVEADQDLYDRWQTVIDAFEDLLNAYSEEYRRRIRDAGVLSHTDAAYLVAEYFHETITNDRFTDPSETTRRRVLDRYRNRFDNLIIDEAQDISTIQHDAFAPLVTDRSRVFLVGDLRQSIYVWRDAQPDLFADAIENGRYLDINWRTHVTETTRKTYRAVPDIVHAVNAIMNPILTDTGRGNLANFDLDMPSLEPARPGADEPRVHVAGFETSGLPGSRQYVTGDDSTGSGEADHLATYIERGLADGTFDIAERAETDTEPTVMVLFRWRTHMSVYAEAFAEQGLTVANATTYLFEAPAVQVVLDVVEWLADPIDTDHLQTLIRDSQLSNPSIESAFEAHDWQLNAVSTADSLDNREQQLVERLQALRDSYDRAQAVSAVAVIDAVIDTLALRADPHRLVSSTDSGAATSDRNRTGTDGEQRVANLDALTAFVTEWDANNEIDLTDLPEVVKPFRDEPYKGPTQPLTEADDYDVIFKTIHQAKGDEADVVALADLGFPLYKHGPPGQRLISSPEMVGLAPPADVQTHRSEELDIFAGLFTPNPGEETRFGAPRYPRNVGLRWTTEQWLADSTISATNGTALVGHDYLQQAVEARRAEAWRLLYVALTRASEHLVLPLPTEQPWTAKPRDRWLESVCDTLVYDGTPRSGTYQLPITTTDEKHTIDIGVNDTELFTQSAGDRESVDIEPFVLTTEFDYEALPAFVPRFLRPSTAYPLLDDLPSYILPHLLKEPLHTDTDTVDPDLPLTFETFDAETVGQFVHEVVTTAIERGLSEEELTMDNQEFARLVEAALKEYGPPASSAERAGLVTFLTDDIIPRFTASTLWDEIQSATAVYVEKPVRAHLQDEDVEIEAEGQADFVIRKSDNTVIVADLKVALTRPDMTTRRRYQYQVELYGKLLRREFSPSVRVELAIEMLGVIDDCYWTTSSDTWSSSLPIRYSR